MSKLLDHAIAYLKKHYACSCDTWASYLEYTPDGFGLNAHAIGVVNLARLTEEMTLLPTALLACCALNEDMVEGFIREDGTREQLMPDDLKLCLAAKDRLVKTAIKIAFCVFRPAVADRCQSRVSCTDTFKIVTANLDSHIDEIANPDLWSVPPLVDQFGGGMLCQPCQVMVKARNARERAAVWRELPEIFGIKLPMRENGAGWWLR